MLRYRLAVVTAVATFLLLMVGGAVNVTGSSLACPEAWFICHGSLFPALQGGVLYEHGHRLVAMSVGLLQLCLTIVLLRSGERGLRDLGVAALALVIVQGTLGAMTVKYQLPTAVSTAHLMTGMGYFALGIYTAWRSRPASRPEPATVSPGLRLALGAAAVAVYLQISLGALVRHAGGALASVDLPLHHGSAWPAGADLPLQLHMLHRLVGLAVGLLVVGVGVAAYRRFAGRPALRRLAALAPALALLQVTLGVLTIYTFRAVPVVVLHVGGAAALWAVFVMLWLNTRSEAPAAHTAIAGREARA